MRILFSLLVFFSPILLHELLIHHRLDLVAPWYAGLLLSPALFQLVRRRRPGLTPLILAAVAVLILTLVRGHELLMLKLTPVFIYVFLFWVFAGSLRPGQVPVITRIAALMREQASERELRYTRKVTWAWALFFITMLATSLVLAIYAPAQVWSVFTNLVSYVLLVAFFLVEFLVRRRVLASEADYSLRGFLVALTRIDLRQALWKAR